MSVLGSVSIEGTLISASAVSHDGTFSQSQIKRCVVGRETVGYRLGDVLSQAHNEQPIKLTDRHTPTHSADAGACTVFAISFSL